MLDQIVGMGELEEEECNFINGIIQKFERLVIKKEETTIDTGLFCVTVFVINY